MHEQFDAAGIEAKSSLNAAVLITREPPRSFVRVVLHLLSVPHAEVHHRLTIATLATDSPVYLPGAEPGQL